MKFSRFCPQSALRAGLALVLLPLVFLSCRGPVQVDLLVIPALKGQIFASSGQTPHQGGVSLVSAWKKEISARGNTVLLVAAGNTLNGSPEASVSQGELVVDALAAIGTQALFLDARDFAFGQERIRELAAHAPFPMSAANLEHQDVRYSTWYNRDWYDPETRTLVIGLPGPWFIQKSLEENVRGYRLENPVQAVAALVSRGKSMATPPLRIVVLALSYRILEDGTGYLWDIASIDGVDCVVQGGLKASDTGMHESPRPGRNPARIAVYDAQAGDQAGLLVDLSFGPDGIPGLKSLKVQESEVAPDPGLQDFLYKSHALIESLLGQTVTEIDQNLEHRDTGESPLGNFFTDLMRQSAGCEIAFINSGALRQGFSRGTIKLKDIYSLLPFGGNLVKGRIDGTTLLAVLDRSLSFMGTPDKGRGLLQVSGLEVRYRVGPDGKPLPLVEGDVKVNGRPLSKTSWYSYCTELFISSGGDGYQELSRAKNVEVNATPLISLVKTWLEKQVLWTASEGNRIAPRAGGPE